MKVVILHSVISSKATPDEQDTLVQAAVIQAALQRQGYSVELLPFDLPKLRFIKRLQALQPQVVFNLVESINGYTQDIHWVPWCLELLGIPYTGNNAIALYLTTHKLLAKQRMMAVDIPTPPWLTPSQITHCATLQAESYLVKSTTEEGSLGIAADSIVADVIALHKVVRHRQRRFGGEWFAEQYVQGREFNIALLENHQEIMVLPIAEIRFNQASIEQPAIVDYAAKWFPASESSLNTMRVFNFTASDEMLLKQLRQISLHCWQTFQLSGYARVDVRVNSAGQIKVLEVNANPCLTPDAGFMAAAAVHKLDEATVIRYLLEIALMRCPKGTSCYPN